MELCGARLVSVTEALIPRTVYDGVESLQDSASDIYCTRVAVARAIPFLASVTRHIGLDGYSLGLVTLALWYCIRLSSVFAAVK